MTFRYEICYLLGMLLLRLDRVNELRGPLDGLLHLFHIRTKDGDFSRLCKAFIFGGFQGIFELGDPVLELDEDVSVIKGIRRDRLTSCSWGDTLGGAGGGVGVRWRVVWATVTGGRVDLRGGAGRRVCWGAGLGLDGDL